MGVASLRVLPAMSEIQAGSRSSLGLSKRGLRIAAAVLGVLVLGVLILKLRIAQIRREAFEQTLAAVAAASVQTLLQQNSARTQRMAESVALAGGFGSVTFSDSQGNVLASSDRKLDHNLLQDMAKAGPKAVIRDEGGRMVGVTGVMLAENNKFGAIRIVSGP